MTARYDWTINQGETSQLTVKRADSGGSYDNTDFAANFRMQIKDKYGGTAVFTSAASNFTSPFDDGSGGNEEQKNSTVQISLTSAETAAIASGKYVYDVENYDSDTPPVVTRVLEGSLIVKPEVTTSA